MTAPARDSSTTLYSWVVDHGPLSVPSTLLLARDVGAGISHLAAADLDATLDSLTADNVCCTPDGRWQWRPRRDRGRRLGLGDASRRIGALMAFAWCGHPVDVLVNEATLRAVVRTSRPDLPPAALDLLVMGALPNATGTSFWPFMTRVEQQLGLDADRSGARAWHAILASVVLTILAGAWTLWPAAPESAARSLTPDDLIVYDALVGSADTAATVDEHTTAIQSYQEAGRLLQSRLGLEDARTQWLMAHESWVRALANDRTTPDQILTQIAPQVAADLGATHPYARTVNLMLVAARVARGLPVERDQIISEAARLAPLLFEGTGIEPHVLADTPTPPGVIAHLSSTRPEIEGFRATAPHRFFMPLSVLQRVLAEQDGWRLHVVTDQSCTVSVTVGEIPRPVSVVVERHQDGWRVRSGGIVPAVSLTGITGDRLGLSFRVDSHGTLDGQVGNTAVAAHLDGHASPATPPYGLAFDEPTRAGACRVVWMEIPVPAGLLSTTPRE